MRRLLIVSLSLYVAACAGKVDYIRPATQVTPLSNVKTVNRNRDAVWNKSVPELGKQFFVINNIDKSSGLMNISYTGDPERYIDCGRITSYVKNFQGERNYNFAAAKAQQTYEIMDQNSVLFFINRKMNLEGRVNLVFEESGLNSTKITANTHYLVTRSQDIRNVANNISNTYTNTISFNSGSSAYFPANAQGQLPECTSTGALELEILSAIK